MTYGFSRHFLKQNISLTFPRSTPRIMLPNLRGGQGAIISYKSHLSQETGGEGPLKDSKYYRQSMQSNRKGCIKRKLRRAVIPKNQKGLQRAIIRTKRFDKSSSLKKTTRKNHSERRFLRESRPHNRFRGGDPGKTPRLLVDPPGQ